MLRRYYRVLGSARRTTYEFVVRGTGDFPLEMLSRDAAWPASEDDAVVMYRDGEERTVRLHSVVTPHVHRWRSFDWNVLEVG